MQRKQSVWVTVAVALAVTTATAADEAGPHVKGRGSVDQTQTKQLSPLEEVKSGGEPLPWRAEVSHARAGLPAWVTLKVRGVLGPGSLYLAGGDGTAITFLASGHLNQVPGPLPVNRADPEGMREQTSQREGDIINGPGYESRHDDTRRPHVNSQFPEDTNGPTAAPVACPVFAMVNDDGLSHPQTPGYEVTCEAEGSGLILQATHVYSNPGQYLLEAHFLDDSLGVVTGRWQAQVEVEELLQVTLGPSRAIPLRDGHAAAFATLSITPPAAPLPLPCPGGLIAWAWDFGDSTGAERGECTSEERAKEEGERMIQEEERGVGRDLEDFLRDAEKRTENLTGLQESGGEGKKEVESTDKREREGGEPEGSREQKKDNPDSFAPSLSYFTTGSPSTTPASTDTPTSTTSTTSAFNTWDSVNDKYTSSTPDSPLSLTPPYPPTLLPGPTSSTVSGPTHAVSSLSSASATRVTSTESDDYPTTSTTATPDGGPFASTVTVRHTYTAPGIFNMSVWLLCGCRRITRKDISPAFTVAEPIRDVQIRMPKRRRVTSETKAEDPAKSPDPLYTSTTTTGTMTISPPSWPLDPNEEGYVVFFGQGEKEGQWKPRKIWYVSSEGTQLLHGSWTKIRKPTGPHPSTGVAWWLSLLSIGIEEPGGDSPFFPTDLELKTTGDSALLVRSEENQPPSSRKRLKRSVKKEL